MQRRREEEEEEVATIMLATWPDQGRGGDFVVGEGRRGVKVVIAGEGR